MDILGAFQTSFAQLIGPSAIFYALLAIGLNLHFGYTGLLNFGQIGFALLGGYGVGIMTVTYHLPLWVGILVGLARRRFARSGPRHSHAPTARRLSGDRHHRRV